MKGLKKFLTGILAGAMALTMTLSAGTAMTTKAAGSNSITVQGAKEGETYNIYKLLDLNVTGLYDAEAADGYLYTINTKWQGFWTGNGAGAAYIDTNTIGDKTYVVWKDSMKTADKMEEFGKAADAYQKANSSTVTPEKDAVTAAKVGNDVVAQFTGLDNGYYMVTSTLGTAVSIASTPTDPVQSIQEKNLENTTEKQVDENGTFGATNDAGIGDTITFRSSITVAKNSTKNVVYHDTMSQGLTWTGAENVSVYTDEACSEDKKVAAANYSVAAGSGTETFTVSFVQTYLDSIANAATFKLYIKYTAVLNDNAVVTSTEKNTPNITWGNNGTFTGQKTETSTHKFQILKYDGTDTSANPSPLAGAKFKLYSSDSADAVALKLAVSSDNKTYRVVYDETQIPAGYTKVADDKIVTIAEDKITVEGVDARNYWIEETDAPAGYNAISGKILVTVSADNNYVQSVENLSGSTLPSTGGIGTTIFYIIGGLLIVAAVVFFVVRRRNDAE